MTDLPQSESAQELTDIRDHTICIVDTREDCEGFLQALQNHGFSLEKTTVLSGAEGTQRFLRIMKGSLWGESAEAVLEDGKVELDLGHFLIFTQTQSSEEAEQVSRLAKQFHGHGVYHFGQLVDTRLTR